MRVEWIDTESGWEAFREIWDDRVEGSERPSIFSTWDFLELSWRHFARPKGDRLAVIVLWQDGEPVGFAPLRLSERRRFGLRLRRLFLLASWEADRVPFVLPRDRAAECVVALLDFLEKSAGRRWDTLDLHEVDASGALLGEVRNWVSGRRSMHLAEEDDSASACIALEGSWESLLARFDAGLRRNIKKSYRRLEARGAYALEVLEEPWEMDSALSSYLDVERRSWKPGAGRGIGRDPRRERFYRELLDRLSRRGRAAVSFLEQGSRRLAATIEYRLGPSVYGAHTCFDASEARLSPGTLVKTLCLRRHLSLGAREYELLGGFLEDKRRWTKDLRPRRRIRLLQRRWLRRTLCLARPVGGPVKSLGAGKP